MDGRSDGMMSKRAWQDLRNQRRDEVASSVISRSVDRVHIKVSSVFRDFQTLITSIYRPSPPEAVLP